MEAHGRKHILTTVDGTSVGMGLHAAQLPRHRRSHVGLCADRHLWVTTQALCVAEGNRQVWNLWKRPVSSVFVLLPVAATLEDYG